MKETNLWEEKNLTEPRMKFENNGVIGQNDTTKNIKMNVTAKDWLGITTIKKSGIYKIINKTNGKYYVGSSKNIICGDNSRWYKHFTELMNHRHKNNKLQHAWNKYGYENFGWVVIEELSVDISKKDLLLVEQKYLDIARNEQDKCYNLCFDASGGELSEESKKKIGFACKGKTLSEEHKQKLRLAKLGKKLSEAHKKNISLSLIGKKVVLSEERKIYLQKFIKSIPNKNYNRDETAYNFSNETTGEVYRGKRCDFIKKYQLNDSCISRLINKTSRLKSFKGWRLSD